MPSDGRSIRRTAGNHHYQRDQLRFAQTQEQPRVDPKELDQKAARSVKHQKDVKDASLDPSPLLHPPQYEKDGEVKRALVDRRGMHANAWIKAWDQVAVLVYCHYRLAIPSDNRSGVGHGPRQSGRCTLIPVPRKLTALAADCVGQGQGGRAHAGKRQPADSEPTRETDTGQQPPDEPAVKDIAGA